MADIGYNTPKSSEDAARQRSAAEIYDELTALSQKTERTKQNREKSMLKRFTTAFAMLGAAMMLISIALIVCAIGWSHEQGTLVPEVVTVEKEVVVEVPDYMILDPSVEYERKLSGEMIALNDSSYGPIWVPVLGNVPKNEYPAEYFVKDPASGYMNYLGTQDYIAGIDVSVFQGDIDWEAVKDAGFEFVMMRCGNRGYVTGLMVEDANFKKNIEGALDAGLEVGVYFFSQALTTEEALEEANFIIDLLKDYNITYPVAYDWEVVHDQDGDTARTAYIEPTDLTNNFIVFAQRLEMEGYTPVLYTNKKTAVFKYDLGRISNYDIWYAEYNDEPSLPYKWSMWQYCSDGSVPGISGNVDLNICFKDYAAERYEDEE